MKVACLDNNVSRMTSHSGVACGFLAGFWVPGLACVHPIGQDPGPCGDRCLDQALSHHLLEPRVEVKVLDATVDRDDYLWKLHLPLFEQELEDGLRSGVVGQAHILRPMHRIERFRGLHD